MARIYAEKLSREVEKKIKKRAYSPDELTYLHGEIKNRHLQKQKGFRRAVAFAAGCVALVGILGTVSISKIPEANPTVMWGSLAATVVICGAALAWTKFFVADRMKNQFVKALRAGYPELEEKFGPTSFQK